MQMIDGEVTVTRVGDGKHFVCPFKTDEFECKKKHVRRKDLRQCWKGHMAEEEKGERNDKEREDMDVPKDSEFSSMVKRFGKNRGCIGEVWIEEADEFLSVQEW